jgi:acetyl esterase/lipase
MVADGVGDAGRKRRRRILGAALGLTALAFAAFVFAVRDLTFLRLSPIDRPIVVARDVVYRPGSTNPKHRLDVFAPKDAHLAPVIHFVHGGYWVGGDKDYRAWVTSLYASVGRALAARGIVTVVQSYRLVPEASFEDLLDDVMAGLRWTEEHASEYGGDPRQIFTMGHSAGGHLVALAAADDSLHTSRGMDPSLVRGTIAVSAVWDLVDMHATQDAAFQERVTYPVFGHDPARWERFSPLLRLKAPVRRFLIVNGTRDYPYLLPQAERANIRLKELGGAPEVYLAQGNDHDAMVLKIGARDDNVTDVIARFVREAGPASR